jgi:hypothetical protein
MNLMVFRMVNIRGSSDSEVNVKISSGGERSVSCNEAENISDNSSMQHDVWANSGSERPCFAFIDKPAIHVDLGDLSNQLEYFQFFCTVDIAEVIAKEINLYAKIV